MSFKANYLKADPAPYFIAEIGINHNGEYDLAISMIDQAKQAGADAVKFQKRNFEALILPAVEIEEPTGYLSKHETDFPDETKAFGSWTYPDKRLEFSDSQVLELWKYAESKGVDFIVSPWEEKSVDFLAENNAKVIKLASIDTTNYQFCEYIAQKGIPTIVSTGMTNYFEMTKTWEIFNKANCPMMFLHCTSAYPSPMADKHLNCIPIMQKMFGEDIGFSGHAVGIEGSLAAITLGANVVEKHVSLSRKMSGPDQAASLEYPEFEQLVKMGANIVTALGHGRKQFLESETVLHNVLAKRIVAAQTIEKGEVITDSKVKTMVTKQEGGILPGRYYEITGAVATADFRENHIFQEGDFASAP